jgi:TPR repeat protein
MAMHKHLLAALLFAAAHVSIPAFAQAADNLAAAQDACNSGNAEACRTGATIALQSDSKLARSLAERGCALNNRQSCDALGMMLVSGAEADRDYVRAAPLLGAACDNGVASTCSLLSSMLLIGVGIPADKPQALARAERGCTLDDARSCAAFGLYLSAGDEFPRDLSRAAPALIKACAASANQACSILEDAAAAAVQGKDPKFEKSGALRMFDAACAGGQPRACGAFGSFLAEGLFSPADPARAAVAFDQGCKLNHAMSCARLAEAYRNGRGVARDTAQARVLAEKAIAIEPGNADAKTTLKRLN